MHFRTFMLFVLLFSQPLAAFNLNCGMPAHDAAAQAAGEAAANDKHCGGHRNVAHDSAHDHQQVPDQYPTGHVTSGGHCQFCASGAFVLPVMTLAAPSLHASDPILPLAEPAPQFLARPLFRPPIL